MRLTLCYRTQIKYKCLFQINCKRKVEIMFRENNLNNNENKDYKNYKGF